MKIIFNPTRLLPAVFAGLMMAAAFGFRAGAQSPYEYMVSRGATMSDVQPGPSGGGAVVSGSIDYAKIPAKARKFLQKHCDGHAVVKCEKEYTSGDFAIALADGIEMSFDAKGNLTEIKAPDSYSLAPVLLRAVVPGKLYHLLDHNGFKMSVEAVHHDNAGYRLDVADPVFNQVCYDPSGVLTLIVER